MGLGAWAAAAAAEPLSLRAAPAALAPDGGENLAVGALAFRGGLHLTSPDPRFGGLSDIRVRGGGAAFTAVTDAGYWIEGALAFRGGRLAGVRDARILPLRGADGAPLAGKERADAEALARGPDGGWIVAFERRHRLLRYTAPGAAATAADILPAPWLRGLAPNAGVEALAFAGGAFLALAERPAAGGAGGWLAAPGGGGDSFAYPADPFFRPAAAARLPGGGFLVLERGYSRAAGAKARVMRMAAPRAGAAAAPREIARLEAPLAVDNFEGLDAWVTPDGGTAVLIVSDDNFNPRQRTLLMLFALAE